MKIYVHVQLHNIGWDSLFAWPVADMGLCGLQIKCTQYKYGLEVGRLSLVH